MRRCSRLRGFDVGVGRRDRRRRLRGFEVASIEPLDGGDAVIDFEITANRPDCLSVVGLAREVATAFGLPLQLPAPAGPIAPGRRRAAIAPRGRRSRTPSCARGTPPRSPTSRSARRPPGWPTRLQAAGVRPISNDRRRHQLRAARDGPADARLRSRRGSPGARAARRAARGRARRIATLDGDRPRRSTPDMLVIADATAPQAVAGVMGGAASEVSAATRTDRVRERVLQAGVGPAHEQAARPEDRGVVALRARRRHQRAASAALAARLRAAASRSAPARRPARSSIAIPPPRGRAVCTCAARASRALLGAAVPDADVDRILRRLGLRRAPAPPTAGTSCAPTFRVDVSREADLIEEVARHYGFDRLAADVPRADRGRRRRPTRASRATGPSGAC